MAAGPEENSFLSQVLSWVAGGIAAIGIWLWTSTMSRIAELEKGKVNQKTFDDYVARSDKDRDERRETEINLFDKVDDLRTHFDHKIDKLADLIRNHK